MRTINEYQNLINEIEILDACELIIIVEGKKDIKSLERIGISKDKIREIKGPIFKFIEDTSSEIINNKLKGVCILTDFDKKGKELYNTLSNEYAKNQIDIDDRFRNFLRKKTRVSHIEGLDSYLESLSREY